MLNEGKPFDARIKETRIKYGLTIKQVERLTGVPYRTLQNWEAGIRKCPEYVTDMVMNILDQKFGRPDYKTVLEEVLKMVERGESRTYTVAYIKDGLKGGGENGG